LIVHKIKKGFDVNVLGEPTTEIDNRCINQSIYCVYPTEFDGIKPKLHVKVGDNVKRGDLLFTNKRMEHVNFRSPACGSISEIKLGDRRFPTEIIINKSDVEESVTFEKFNNQDISNLSSDNLKKHLLNSGLWPLIKQRPFNKIANPADKPKSIFINACNNAPFQADFSVILKGDEDAFQLGINALNILTEGKVNLCISDGIEIPDFENISKHVFKGKYPSGNTSVHINKISPILPMDIVYTLGAQDVILIGKLLMSGEIPRTKIIALAGPSIKEEYRKYYKVPFGGSLENLLNNALEEDEEIRLICGNVMYGTKVALNTCVNFYGSEYFALAEDRSRHLLGWTMPGIDQYSAHRVTLSALFNHKRKLGTNQHGSHRAMVVTGWMDKYQPLNIMTDYLVRSALAHDTEEMVQLGILETDPEDFAIASFVDPHKTDVCKIIKKGLEEIEEEGL
jgi:Na+-transporting NADH:ubiquinone oxidoreductase subunit A